jgi:hypothetical protein
MKATKETVKKAEKATGQQKVMAVEKRTAAILYRKMPQDMIEIVDFEGIMTADELEKEYGEHISDLYLSYHDNMLKRFNSHNCQQYLEIYSQGGRIQINIGQLMPKKDFSELVDKVRTCGSLLHQIVEALWSTENTVRKIKI